MFCESYTLNLFGFVRTLGLAEMLGIVQILFVVIVLLLLVWLILHWLLSLYIVQQADEIKSLKAQILVYQQIQDRKEKLHGTK